MHTPLSGSTWCQLATALQCCLLVNISLLLISGPAAVLAANKCTPCGDIVKNIHQGLKDTAKSNFGGGNTNWEEKHLGAYAFSETRLVEIFEKGCDDSSKECHSILEAAEEILEEWWFQHYAKKKDTDLHKYLCIEQIKACCPSGRYGPDCEQCPGGDLRPCKGNGACDGNGTREGTGKCRCQPGYQGEICDDCKFGYFELEHNDTDTVCTECHESCKGSCTELGPTGCTVCKEGWIKSEEEGCLDVNECEAEEAVCEEDQYCSNTEGSYKCTACDNACEGCTGAGSASCVACAQLYYRHDEKTCKKCHQSCATSCTHSGADKCDACKEGWLQTERGCTDVNECNDDDTCADDEFCVNLAGSYRCSACHASCVGCSGGGSAKCKQCKEGYETDDKGSCNDIDECSHNNTCAGDNEQCLNTAGSYDCQCNTGFVREDDVCVTAVKEKEKKKEKKKKKKKRSSETGPGSCHTCRGIVENVYSGIMQTEKANFGGGNTKWEEAKLGSYEYSETRLIEILDHICGNKSECYNMLEANEDKIEKWWFNHFAKQQNRDLYTHLCIDRLKVCCPNGTAGPDCRECVGGRERPCRGNGECLGEGTRTGNAVCNCTQGYKGWECDDCQDLYYEELKNDTHTVCEACHPACDTACFDAGPEGCEDCKEGWHFEPEQGCIEDPPSAEEEDAEDATASETSEEAEGSLDDDDDDEEMVVMQGDISQPPPPEKTKEEL